MAWEKASPEMMVLLGEAMQRFDCTSRKMFGSTTYFVNGNMLCGVLGQHIMLRMAPEDRAAAFAEYGESVAVEPMGRRMREYIAVPHAISDDSRALTDWLQRGYDFVAAMPPKQK